MKARLLRLAPYVLLATAAFCLLRVYVPVRVAGSSMYPALRIGDVVFVAKRTPRVGEIALIRPAGHSLVLHRVVGDDGGGALRTKGDANAFPDLSAVSATEVVGTVVRVLPVGMLLERWRGD